MLGQSLKVTFNGYVLNIPPGFSRAEWRLKPDLVKVSPGDAKMPEERKRKKKRRRRRRNMSGNKNKHEMEEKRGEEGRVREERVR